MPYKAFISYSHAADGKLAPALQSGLKNIARPVYRPSIRIFRDETNLQVTPALWPTIQQSLRESENFILMSSPEAAKSKWVQAEIEEWFKLNTSVKNFHIVLTEGEIVWDDEANDFDWGRTTALPGNLQAKFSAQPLHLDFRWAKNSDDLSLRNPKFFNLIGRLVAAIRNEDPEVIIGEDVKRLRRFKLIASLIIAILVLFLVVAIAAALYARQQTSFANEQARIAQEQTRRATFQTRIAQEQTEIARAETIEKEKALEQAKLANQQAEQRRKEKEEANRQEQIARKETADTKRGAEAQKTEDERTRYLASGREELTNHNPFQAAVYLSEAYNLSPLNEDPSKTSTLRLLLGLSMRLVESLRYIKNYQENIVSAKFSPDGKNIAIAGADNKANTENMARVLDAETGEETIRPVIHKMDVNTVEFSFDSQRMVSTTDDDYANVVDLKTQNLISFKHPVAVRSARFSPDAEQLATIDRRGRVAIWDVKNNQDPIFAIEAKEILISINASLKREADLKSVAISPHIKHFVIVDYAGGVIVWNIKERKVVAKLIPQTAQSETNEIKEVNSAKFSVDEKQLVIASSDKTATVLDLKTGEVGLVLPHQELVISADFSPDSKRIVTVTPDQRANVWDVQTGKLISSLPHQNAINSARFSASGEQVVTTSDDKTAVVWEVETGKVLAVLQHSGFVQSAEFSPNGEKVVTVSRDKTVQVWNVKTEVPASVSHGGSVVLATFSDDGKRLVTASWDGTATVLDLTPGVVTEPFTFKQGRRVRSARFSHDGKRIVTCSDNVAKIWDVETRQPIPIPILPQYGPCWAAEFSPDDKQIVTSRGGGRAEVLDLETKRIIALKHERDVNSARFSPDGNQIVTASTDDTARVWDIRKIWSEAEWNGKEVLEVEPEEDTPKVVHADIVMSATFSPNGELVVTASKDRTANILNLKTKQVVASIAHEGLVITAEFSPNGKWIVTASDDGTAKIWDVENQKEVYPVHHNGRVRSAKFSPDSKQFVTASADGTAKVWDVDTGKLLVSIAHQKMVRTAEFSCDGQRIVTASFDKTAKVWNFPRETRTREEIAAIIETRLLVPRQDILNK